MTYFKIEKSFRIRPVFLRTLGYLFILTFVLIYFLSKWLEDNKTVDILSIDTSSAIFWMIVIFIILGHLDLIKEIVKDIVRSKISEFATSSYFRESISQLLADEEFRAGINNIMDRPTDEVRPELPSSQEELDNSNKL
jgi:hypothetical protein